MPLTPFQKEVMAVLAANRSEASHLAGGMVINAADDSARFSKDFDIFNDSVEELASSSERDLAALSAAGFHVEKVERDNEWSRVVSFRKARVSRDGASVEVDWAHDSVFRFFPVVRDEVLGWKLHLFDIAVNTASDQAREEMTALADEQPDVPIGVAFVDAKGEPGWIRRDPSLHVHYPSLRGCWPSVH